MDDPLFIELVKEPFFARKSIEKEKTKCILMKN
jgi:hypothetical protein